MLWHLNKNERGRDEIIFGKHEPNKYMGGIRRFEGLTADKLQELVDLEFIDLDENKNAAPSTQKFLEFMQKYPEYKACGFVVSVKRRDYHMIVDGLTKEAEADNLEELMEFRSLFGKANEYEESDKRMNAWFD